MRIQVCGARGSTPAPGPLHVGYGGHTSCVAVSHDGAAEPSLVLDAGTGIRNVTALLGGRPFRGTILLTHLHWDHVQGLPFFVAADRPDAEVTVRIPRPDDGSDVVTLLSRAMSPPHFPISPAELIGQWDFEPMDVGRITLEGFEIEAKEVHHKGGRTLGYRVSDGRSTLTYIPDHGLREVVGEGGQFPDDVLKLAGGADLLIHDAMFRSDEEAQALAYSHCIDDDAVRLAEKAGVHRVALFHHAPQRTDDALDDVAVRLKGSSVDVVVAREGDVYTL